MRDMKVYAAFCGTGKTYLCKNFPDTCVELECWEYRKADFPDNYIKDILGAFKKSKYLFISTDPIVLKKLYDIGFVISLIYPRSKLKSEYMKRFVNRNSDPDFINAINNCWDIWLNAIKQQDYCIHTILKSGEYLQNVLAV